MTLLQMFYALGVTLVLADTAFVDGITSVLMIPPLIVEATYYLPPLFAAAVLVVFGYALIKFVLSFF